MKPKSGARRTKRRKSRSRRRRIHLKRGGDDITRNRANSKSKSKSKGKSKSKSKMHKSYSHKQVTVDIRDHKFKDLKIDTKNIQNKKLQDIIIKLNKSDIPLNQYNVPEEINNDMIKILIYPDYEPYGGKGPISDIQNCHPSAVWESLLLNRLNNHPNGCYSSFENNKLEICPIYPIKNLKPVKETKEIKNSSLKDIININKNFKLSDKEYFKQFPMKPNKIVKKLKSKKSSKTSSKSKTNNKRSKSREPMRGGRHSEDDRNYVQYSPIPIPTNSTFLWKRNREALQPLVDAGHIHGKSSPYHWLHQSSMPMQSLTRYPNNWSLAARTRLRNFERNKKHTLSPGLVPINEWSKEWHFGINDIISIQACAFGGSQTHREKLPANHSLSMSNREPVQANCSFAKICSRRSGHCYYDFSGVAIPESWQMSMGSPAHLENWDSRGWNHEARRRNYDVEDRSWTEMAPEGRRETWEESTDGADATRNEKIIDWNEKDPSDFMEAIERSDTRVWNILCRDMDSGTNTYWQSLLIYYFTAIIMKKRRVLIHCWGGYGRTTTATTFLSLLDNLIFNNDRESVDPDSESNQPIWNKCIDEANKFKGEMAREFGQGDAKTMANRFSKRIVNNFWIRFGGMKEKIDYGNCSIGEDPDAANQRWEQGHPDRGRTRACGTESWTGNADAEIDRHDIYKSTKVYRTCMISYYLLLGWDLAHHPDIKPYTRVGEDFALIDYTSGKVDENIPRGGNPPYMLKESGGYLELSGLPESTPEAINQRLNQIRDRKPRLWGLTTVAENLMERTPPENRPIVDLYSPIQYYAPSQL